MQQSQDLSALRTYLNLTDAQMMQLRQAGEQARRQAEEKARASETQIREKRMALEDLLARETNDAAAVGRLMLEIRALEKQTRDAWGAVRTSQLNVLTAEQKTKFRAIEEAAALPQAARDAVRLGLVQGPPDAGGPPNQPPIPRRAPGPGPAPGGPRPPNVQR